MQTYLSGAEEPGNEAEPRLVTTIDFNDWFHKSKRLSPPAHSLPQANGKKEMYLIVLKPERRLGEPSTENTLWLLKMNVLLIILTLAKIAQTFISGTGML